MITCPLCNNYRALGPIDLAGHLMHAHGYARDNATQAARHVARAASAPQQPAGAVTAAMESNPDYAPTPDADF